MFTNIRVLPNNLRTMQPFNRFRSEDGTLYLLSDRWTVYFNHIASAYGFNEWRKK